MSLVVVELALHVPATMGRGCAVGAGGGPACSIAFSSAVQVSIYAAVFSELVAEIAFAVLHEGVLDRRKPRKPRTAIRIDRTARAERIHPDE
ncbi:hypothetical protein [Streptomyces inhibens]|uniref:hypothetical protein n=1 Tax=Streptomyces inhibens TaxID=2293571 RepID=UPI001EE74E08|nr:hypothetical protein [Streptomyces inhibens]UKY48164.1 hypothetical protein KI385_04610 [Streptomyces inhibens]